MGKTHRYKTQTVSKVLQGRCILYRFSIIIGVINLWVESTKLNILPLDIEICKLAIEKSPIPNQLNEQPWDNHS